MDDNGTQNGQPNGKIYVRFGPGETQEMPLEWAEKMLTEWRAKDPKRWGALLSDIITRGQ
jgi:hypothetical protein